MYHYFLLILTIVTFYLINNWIVYLNALLVSHPSPVYSNGNVAQAAKHAMIVCPLNGVDSSRQFCSLKKKLLSHFCRLLLLVEK